jgi:hypothetical protein
MRNPPKPLKWHKLVLPFDRQDAVEWRFDKRRNLSTPPVQRKITRTFPKFTVLLKENRLPQSQLLERDSPLLSANFGRTTWILYTTY